MLTVYDYVVMIAVLISNLKDYAFFFGTPINVIVSCTWFLSSTLFYNRTSPEYQERIEDFFKTMHKPVDFEKEAGEAKDNEQSKIPGLLCLVYGGAFGADPKSTYRAGRLCLLRRTDRGGWRTAPLLS